MRFPFQVLLIALVVLPANVARGQAPGQGTPGFSRQPAKATLGLPISFGAEARPSQAPSTAQEELVARQAGVQHLQTELTAAQGALQQDDTLKKKVELLEKQIDVQQKMIKLLKEQVEKQPPAGAAVEKLETKVITLEARSKQAAQRDQELAQAVDNLSEHLDATERNGPRLPATLKEWFLPSRTNETPLSIYGTLVGGYELFPDQRGAGRFFFEGFQPVFLLQLNDHILLETELEFGLEEVEVGYAQMDYIVTDWLTVVAGRYLAPIGFFNERIHTAWINKLPDPPLMFRQVSPGDFSLNGVQLRGAQYLFDSPVKLEYSLYAANGLRLPAEEELTALANLGELAETTTDINDAIAWGGRLGFWVPEWGFNAGFSTFFNRPYDDEAGPHINLWGFDFGFRKGNWDVRFEYANMYQRSPPLPGEEEAGGGAEEEGEGAEVPEEPAPLRIRRRGFYFQVAYRPLDSAHQVLRNTEFVFRFGRVRFRGIHPDDLELHEFRSPVDVPVDRNQYTFGINYYFYPSLVWRVAYQINQERGIDLNDNVFLTQLAWGF